MCKKKLYNRIYLNYLIQASDLNILLERLTILDVFQIISLEIIVTSDPGKYNNRVRVF